jgi:hypothetical protein
MANPTAHGAASEKSKTRGLAICSMTRHKLRQFMYAMKRARCVYDFSVMSKLPTQYARLCPKCGLVIPERVRIEYLHKWRFAA